MNIEKLPPEEIERRSFEIIRSGLNRVIDRRYEPVVLRVIHTTADFEYAELLSFSENALGEAAEALKRRETIVTDTNMSKAGITRADALGIDVVCYMADTAVAEEAKRRGVTRAEVSMEKASGVPGRPVFVIGNAPTALIRLCGLIRERRVCPSLIIGAPVGFVNVVQSKELLMSTYVPYICVRGRKGGSAVAAAIINALIVSH
jgi:precorrin-8X/cobalt-precorrin-8 methylmutase